jgi:Holliday junction resolvasome RuvABC DNA-binding subunit
MSFTATYNCLNGTTQRINAKILKTLEELGYDPDKVEKECQEFRAAKQRELIQGAI